jgi:hypothetical protein
MRVKLRSPHQASCTINIDAATILRSGRSKSGLANVADR